MPDAENAPAPVDAGAASGSSDPTPSEGASSTPAPVQAAPDYAKLYEEQSARTKALEEYVPKLHGVFERIQKSEEARLKALGMLPEKEEPQYLTRQDFEKFTRQANEERARERAEQSAVREIESFMTKAETEHPDVFGDPDLRDLFYARVANSPKTPLDQIASGIVKAAEARSAKWLDNYSAGKTAAPRIVKTGGAGNKPASKKLDLGDRETRIAAILGDIGTEASA